MTPPLRDAPPLLVAVGAAVFTALVAALPCTGAARAQTLTVGVAGTLSGPRAAAAGAGARVSLAVGDAPVGGSRVDLGLAYDTSDGAAQLDFGVRATDTFGPLGNVIGEGHLTLRTDARAQGDVGVRGVLGPVALGLRLTGFSADPAVFDPFAVAADARPDFGSGGFGAALSGRVRVSRSVIVQADPELYVVPAGVAARLAGRVRLLGALGRNELSVRARSYLAPGAASFDAALGVGLTIKRRRAPDLDGAVYLGWSPHGPAPAATASVAQQLGPVLASLALAAEPDRLDVPPYRASLGLGFALGPGTAHVLGAAVTGEAGPAASLGLRYELPLSLTP